MHRESLTRRDFLRYSSLAGGAAFFHRFFGIPQTQADAAGRVNAVKKRINKTLIFIGLNGGFSHLDSWDFKSKAPAEIRGALQPIPLRTGAVFSSWFPRLAQNWRSFTVLNGLEAKSNDHVPALHYWLTQHDGGAARCNDWEEGGGHPTSLCECA